MAANADSFYADGGPVKYHVGLGFRCVGVLSTEIMYVLKIVLKPYMSIVVIPQLFQTRQLLILKKETKFA